MNLYFSSDILLYLDVWCVIPNKYFKKNDCEKAFSISYTRYFSIPDNGNYKHNIYKSNGFLIAMNPAMNLNFITYIYFSPANIYNSYHRST